jgi:hypothetical protein
MAATAEAELGGGGRGAIMRPKFFRSPLIPVSGPAQEAEASTQVTYEDFSHRVRVRRFRSDVPVSPRGSARLQFEIT